MGKHKGRQTQKNRGVKRSTDAKKKSTDANGLIRKLTRKSDNRSQPSLFGTQNIRPHTSRVLRKSTNKQGQYVKKSSRFSIKNNRSSYKSIGYRNKTGEFLVEPPKSTKRNLLLIAQNKNRTFKKLSTLGKESLARIYEDDKTLENELRLQNELSKYRFTPKTNTQFSRIVNTKRRKHPLRAFYVEEKTPLTKFNPKTSNEVIMALQSVLEKATEMVHKKGFIHTDMKEDNLVIDIGKIHKGGPNKGSRRIEIFFIDVSPIFFTQLFDPKQSNNEITIRIKPNQNNNASKDYSIVYDIEKMEQIVPFITLCQLVLSPSMDSTNVFGLSKIQTDAMELEINEGIERDENEHFIRLEMIATLMREYISHNNITFELFTKYLNGINYIMQSQGKHFSLTTLMNYYLFEDKDVTNHDAQYNVNNQIGELIRGELDKYQIYFKGDEY